MQFPWGPQAICGRPAIGRWHAMGLSGRGWPLRAAAWVSGFPAQGSGAWQPLLCMAVVRAICGRPAIGRWHVLGLSAAWVCGFSAQGFKDLGDFFST